MIRARRAVGLALALALALPAAGAPAAAPVTLPARTRLTLSNGLRVVILPVHRLPLVDLVLVADAGAVRDPPGREGLASLTADLLTRGAAGRSAQQVAEDIEFVGGTLGATAGAERLVVSCEVLSRDLAAGLELFRDAIVSPRFAAAEFARRKEEALGSIASAADDPAEVADRALLPLVFGDGALGHPAVGWAASVKSLTRGDVVAFHRRHVTPGSSLLAVVGDVEPQAVAAALEAAFGGWRAAAPAAPAAPSPPRAVADTVEIVDLPGLAQAHLRLGGPCVPRDSPDRDAVEVANAILGDGFASRLVDRVRVSRGLTYDIASEAVGYRDAGLLRIDTFTRNDSLRACVDEVHAALATLVRDGPTPAELERVKRYLAGQHPLGLQAPDELAMALLDLDFYGLPADGIESYGARIEAVTMADVRRVLQAWFAPERLRLLVVADPAAARPALAGLGPVRVVEPR